MRIMEEGIKKLYDEHFNEVAGASNLDGYSEADVDRVLMRLLQCLPNNGKLYKYRAGTGNAFKNAYHALVNGYIWLAQASTLNDECDTTICFDPVKNIEEVKQLLLSRPATIFAYLIRKAEEDGTLLFSHNQLHNEVFCDVIACYDVDTGKLDRQKASIVFSRYGFSPQEGNAAIERIDYFVCSFFQANNDTLREICENYLTINKSFREKAVVFSVSESFDSDTMWAYYANNKGFCIEYDYNKVLRLPVAMKRLFMSFYKVIYSDEKGEVSFIPNILYYVGNQTDKTLLAESSKARISQLVTKQEKWKEEKEWRLFLFNADNKLFADLVSAIYIDKAMLVTKNGRKLLSLAKGRGWRIYVRELNYIMTQHIFNSYY